MVPCYFKASKYVASNNTANTANRFKPCGVIMFSACDYKKSCCASNPKHFTAKYIFCDGCLGWCQKVFFFYYHYSPYSYCIAF